MNDILYNAFKKIKQSINMSEQEYHNVNDLLLISDLINKIDSLEKQLLEANAVITHSVFDSKDSSDIAYNYLAKYGLIKAERNNQI